VGKMNKDRFIKTPASRKGIAIAMTLFAVVILSILVLGIASVGVVKSKSTVSFFQSQRAYYVARAGIIYGATTVRERYLSENYLGGTKEPIIKPVGDNEKFVVNVWAHPDNMKASRKLWRVTSEGFVDGAYKKLVAWMDMGTFAEYTYFSDVEAYANSEPDPDKENRIWFMGPEINGAPAVAQIRGKVHTNGFFNIYGKPIFDGIVTSSNGDGKFASDPIQGKDDPYYDPFKLSYNQEGSTTNNPSKFYHFKNDYSEDYPVGANKDFSFTGAKQSVELPDNPDKVKEGANVTYEKDIKVTFQDNGQVKVVPVGSGITEYWNTHNLTLHTTGKIIIEGGKFKGLATLGADKCIEITDSIVYTDKAQDVLGIVAGDNIVVITDPEVKKDLTIHGSLMALKGSFYVKDHDTGITRGTLTVFGGIINKYRGPIGRRKRTTKTDSDGNIIEETITHSGYFRDYAGDGKLMNRPPPNFPGTSELRVTLIYDESAL
jgi:hypothetical protein